MGLYEDFKKFLVAGNLVSMAVAFVVGLAIVALVGALVNDIINPLIGSVAHVDFERLGRLNIHGSVLLGGALLGAVINFGVLMAVVFFTIAYPYQRYEKREAEREEKKPPTTRDCPSCFNAISVKATRCGFCTSSVTPASP